MARVEKPPLSLILEALARRRAETGSRRPKALTILDILAGLSLIDPCTAPSAPFLMYGSGCLKAESQYIYPDPAELAGDTLTKALALGLSKITQPAVAVALKKAFTPLRPIESTRRPQA